MSTNIILLLLANAGNIVSSSCVRSGNEPKVTVADSNHLLVNWEKSFEGCDTLSANVHIGGNIVGRNIADKEAKIEINPCLAHTHITVKMQLDKANLLWSHTSHYNDYTATPKIEELYSGLLQKQVVDKTCVTSKGTLFVPDVPDENVNPVQFRPKI